MAKRILIFATRSDYEPVIQAIERRRRLQYVLYGLFDTPTLYIAHSALELDSLGIATDGSTIGEKTYRVLDADKEVPLKEVPQRDGTMRYTVPNHPESISATWGGLFDGVFFRQGGPVELPPALIAKAVVHYHTPMEDTRIEARCMIAGDIGTISEHPNALALMGLFRREIQKRFTRIGRYWVGPDALSLMDAGMRLTMNVGSPDSADLRCDQ